MDRLLTGLRAAAEPTRLRLLALCAHSELTVTELTQILSQSQPRVSRHLKLLCEAGLLDRFREGTWAFYRLAEDSSCAYLARTLIDLIPEDDPALARDLERLQRIKEARARAAAEYFRANAESWDEIRAMYVADADLEQAMLDAASDQEIEDFLDIGTGTGRILEVFAPRIRRGLGVDLSHEMLRVARANLERAGFRHCQVRQGDMYNLSLDNASCDLAIIHHVLHFAEDPRQVIAEAGRVLRPGGQLIIADFAPHTQDFLRDEHQHRWLGFDEAEVSRWCLAAGLEPGPVRRLDGSHLNVLLWRARRPNRTGRGAAAARTIQET